MSQTPNSIEVPNLDSTKFSKKKRNTNSSIKPPRGRKKSQNKSKPLQVNLPIPSLNDAKPISTINEENILRIEESQGNFTTLSSKIYPVIFSEEHASMNEPSDQENEGSYQEDDPVESALKKLRCDDPESILNTLLDLSSELSLAHESMAENPNCKNLLKELLTIIDKFNMPELSSNNYLKLIISVILN